MITHEYDSMDRLSTRTDPLGRRESYQYDPTGNLTQFTDRKNQVSTFTYDALNRRTRSTFSDGSFTEFTYDAGGRLLTATDSVTGTITEEYDGLDRLTREVTPQGAIQYAYDALGRRTAMTVNGQVPVSYGYDVASRLTQIVQAPLNPVILQYDAAGRRIALTLPNGVSTAYDYDPASRLTRLTYTGPSGLLGDLTYQYDPARNPIGVAGSLARTLLPNLVPSATYDLANQQLAFGGRRMTFDGNGNLTSIVDSTGSTTLTWDARNRLVALSAPGLTASFQYDALGRRALKALTGQTVQYHYDGADIIRELVEGTEVNYLRTFQLDEALSRDGSEFYIAEATGSTLALADSSATVTTTYAYDPFGRTAVGGGLSPNPLQFTARENDGTGLYYYRARYYSPTLHRFLSEDPIRAGQGMISLYSYAANSPTRYRDPDGLFVAGVTAEVGAELGLGPWLSAAATGSVSAVTNFGGDADVLAGGGAFGRLGDTVYAKPKTETGPLLPSAFGLGAGGYVGLILSSAETTAELTGTTHQTTIGFPVIFAPLVGVNLTLGLTPTGKLVVAITAGPGVPGASITTLETYTISVSEWIQSWSLNKGQGQPPPQGPRTSRGGGGRKG